MFEGIYDLPGMSIFDYEESEEEFTLHLKPLDPITCPYCEKTHLGKDGKYTKKLSDIPIKDKHTIVIIHSHRYKCLSPNCREKVFIPSFPEVFSPHAQITNRLRIRIENLDIHEKTIKGISKQYFISEATINRIINKKYACMEQEELKVISYAPRTSIGIDECHIGGRMRLVVTDLSGPNATIIDMAPDRKKDTAITYLSRFEDPDKVEFVMMDMSRGYKEAAEFVFPNAEVVVDKYHVIAYLIKATEESRKLACEYIEVKISMLPEDQRVLQKEKWDYYKKHMNHFYFCKDIEHLTPKQALYMSQLGKEFPEFRSIIKIKEAFRAIYKLKSRKEADKAFEAWRRNPDINDESSFLYPFCTAGKTFGRWKNCILNYFDVPDGQQKTNAGTEGINSEIKRIHAQGRGYSFKKLRLKMLQNNPEFKDQLNK